MAVLSLGVADDVAIQAVHRPDDHDRPLVVDEIDETFDRFRALLDTGQADAVLDELGAHGPTDQAIILELAATHPLQHPERFLAAHVLALHSLEALQRNGPRVTSMPRIGPLKPIASWAVQQITRFIVRNHQSDVIDAVTRLYARRLAWCPPGDPHRMMLLRARLDTERALPTYKGKALGLPTFLVGGAVVSGLGQGLRAAGNAFLGSRLAGGIGVAILFAVFAGLAWSIVKGAAVARHRIRLTVERPLKALYETIGHCGNPPTDNARQFALVGIILTGLGWLIIPLGAFLVGIVL